MADEHCTRFSLLIQRAGAGSISFETDRPEQIITYVTHYMGDRRGDRSVEIDDLSAFVGRTLAEVEHALILATMRQFQFDRARTARVLGISVETLSRRLRQSPESGTE